MRKNNSSNEQTTGINYNHIPDIEIVDLEVDGNTDTPDENVTDELPEIIPENPLPPIDDEEPLSSTEEESEEKSSKKNIRSFLNMHTLLLFVFVVFVICIVAKFKNWGVRIDISNIEHDSSGTYLDVLDHIIPLMDAEGNIVETGEADTILVFGNAPFADDRDSEDNLANLIEKATGATVYNCSVSNSYLASVWRSFDAYECAMDAYTFYWLACLAALDDFNEHFYPQAAEVLGEDTPPEAQEVYETLASIDLNDVDVIAIMYDATDYLMGHAMYDDSSRTNIQQFTGNLEAGIEIIQNYYPHIRIIVMSPTYAYAIDENGEYVSSDMYIYNDRDVLSTYVIKQRDSCSYRNVSFIDNLYGTITEDNADDYLTDNLHLNVEGRKLVAQRFIDALNKYNK